MLHYAMIEKFAAELRDALPKVELISTSRNDGGNENVASNVWQSVTLGIFFCNLCRNKIATQVCCTKNCLVQHRHLHSVQNDCEV